MTGCVGMGMRALRFHRKLELLTVAEVAGMWNMTNQS